jgi:peroxiredoxin
LLGAAVVVVALALILQSDAGAPPVTRGAAAPGFDLKTLSEEGSGRLSLDSLEGKVVLVNFWATWCEPCEREMPAMERLYNALPREDFEMVAISIDESAEEVASFQDRYRLSFPIVLDSDKRVNAAYQTMGVPESLLIDGAGRVVERYVGPREWDSREYVDRIRELIDGGAGRG